MPNNKESKYMRQKLIELQETDESIMIVRGSNIPLYQTWTDAAGRK